MAGKKRAGGPRQSAFEELQERFAQVGLGWFPLALLLVVALGLTVLAVRVATIIFASMR